MRYLQIEIDVNGVLKRQTHSPNIYVYTEQLAFVIDRKKISGWRVNMAAVWCMAIFRAIAVTIRRYNSPLQSAVTG